MAPGNAGEPFRLRKLKRRILRLERADRIFSFIAGFVTVLTLILIGAAYYDMYRFTREGIDTVEYHDFGELIGINPDTVAWLTMDGTHIDHPVVQGKDNFEYLDKNFYGRAYAGGTLFLAADCPPDFLNPYQIIHGHHMAGGAMFGDLGRYRKKDFFNRNSTGQLLTREQNYDLKVIGTGMADAYDSEVYSARRSGNPAAVRGKCSRWRNVKWKPEDKLLCLSTCSGEMDDTRTVVFCRMRARTSDGKENV